MGTCLCYAALKMQGFFPGRQWVSFGGGYVYQMTALLTLSIPTEQLQAHSCALGSMINKNK